MIPTRLLKILRVNTEILDVCHNTELFKIKERSNYKTVLNNKFTLNQSYGMFAS